MRHDSWDKLPRIIEKILLELCEELTKQIDDLFWPNYLGRRRSIART